VPGRLLIGDNWSGKVKKRNQVAGLRRYSLDVSVVIVENEEQRLVFGQVGYEVIDPLLEFCPRNFHARAKVVMLSGMDVCEERKVFSRGPSHAPHGNWKRRC
jgi:hypothetical protein